MRSMAKYQSENLVIGAGLVGVTACALVVWELASVWLFVIPSPLETWISFNQSSGEVLTAARATFSNAAIGFALAVVVGALLGVLLGRSDYWYRVFNPIIVVGGAVPKIIIYPILLLLLGLGPVSVISMGFIGGIFAMLINVMAGVRNIKPVYIKVGRSLNISPWRAAYRIYLPAVSLPLLTGVRLCFGLTLVNVVFAEIIAAEAGMGKIIMRYYNLGKYPGMMAMIMMLFLVATIGSIVLWGIERRTRRALT